MIKRVVVAGCRDYEDYAEAEKYISFCISNIQRRFTLVFMSGCCRGADRLGERYAMEKGYALERYPAAWKIDGKKAGPIRNRKMAEKGDYFICFWDGKSTGTMSLIQYAMQRKKPVRIYWIPSKEK